MIDAPNTPPTRSETPAGRPRGTRRGGRLAALALLTLPALVLGGFFATRAMARPGGAGGWHHRHHAEFTEAEARERAVHFTKKLVNRVDGTDAQRAALEGIIDQALPEMISHRAEGKVLKKKFRDALTKKSLDRAELETLRQEALQLADRASASALDRLVEASEVLTEDQREELVEDLRRLERWAH